MATPSITQAQLLALLTWVTSQGVAYGFLPQRWEQLAVSITATVVAAVWHIADAVIRHGRSRALAPAAPPVAPVTVPPASPTPPGA